MSDQDPWPIISMDDRVDKSTNRLRQMRIFIAIMAVAFLLVACIIMWAAHNKKAKSAAAYGSFTNSYQTTNTTPTDESYAASRNQGVTRITGNTDWQNRNTEAHPTIPTEQRPFNTRDSVDDQEDTDTSLKLQMQTMRDTYEGQLAQYRQQLEDQRQLIATQRLLIEQLQTQSKQNTPNSQNGYAGFYRCSNCGEGINWVQTSASPDASVGGKCPASANGHHFWIKM